MELKAQRMLTFQEIVCRVAATTGLAEKEAKSAINSLIEVIAEEVTKGRRCRVSGLGTFQPVTRKGRVCFNPKTREPIKIRKRIRLMFKPGHRTRVAIDRATELLDLHDLAHLMVSELLLYNSNDIDEGIRRQDLEERLKGKLSDARASFLNRIPPGVPEDMSIFEDALGQLITKRTLALQAME